MYSNRFFSQVLRLKTTGSESESVILPRTPLARSSRPTLTLYFGLLSSVLTLYSGLLSSALRDSLHLLLSSFFWKVVVLQDGLLLLSLFTYLLVGADLVESGPRR